MASTEVEGDVGVPAGIEGDPPLLLMAAQIHERKELLKIRTAELSSKSVDEIAAEVRESVEAVERVVQAVKRVLSESEAKGEEVVNLCSNVAAALMNHQD